jgi:hypothetical protein
MTLIRACRTAMDEGAQDGNALPLENIKNRIREMETRLYNNELAIDGALRSGTGVTSTDSFAGEGFSSGAQTGLSGSGVNIGNGTSHGGPVSAAETASPSVPQQLPPALPEEIRTIAANWSEYASKAPHGSRRIALTHARLSLGDHGQLLIVFEKEYGNPYLYQRKDDDETSRARVDNDRRDLQNYLQGKVGKAVEIEYRVLDRGSRITDNYVDLLSLVDPDAIRMPIETEDI